MRIDPDDPEEISSFVLQTADKLAAAVKKLVKLKIVKDDSEVVKRLSNYTQSDINTADELAYAVLKLVEQKVIDARSEAGDELLWYAGRRFGTNDPINDLRKRMEKKPPSQQ